MTPCMRRPSVTIVIPAWNAWDSTRKCLQSLRPTLGVHDHVVVVDNGSSDATPVQLRQFPWVDVVTNPENRGFAGGCNDGAATARGEVIVFLNNDTQVHGRWLDALVQPMAADPVVAATGPRSNMVSGPQQIEGADYQTAADMRRFARTWANAHRQETSPTERLVGFCLAVRRSVFEEVCGFDEAYGIGGYEDDDLCRRLTGAGYRLLIAHESFVHHDGHRTFDANGLDWFAEQESNREQFHTASTRSDRRHPLVSACLIVKDEEENLAACLGSLQGFADEIIVYDTGSTDATVALARDLGATVIEGYWDDDFARARNLGLQHCRGSWVVWLDADETLVCDDMNALRQVLLQTKAEVDAWSVAIDNLTGAGLSAGFVHHAARIFRRARCEWSGRLHEQVTRRQTHGGIHQAILETARIRHTGYLDVVMRARNKSERNLRVAEREVAEAAGWHRGFSLTSLGRANLTAGRVDASISYCTEALEQTDNVITRRLAMRTLAEAFIATGDFDRAADWADELRRTSTTPVQADVIDVSLALHTERFDRALELLDALDDPVVDEDGFEYTSAMLAPLRAEALAGLGRLSESADVLLRILRDLGTLDTHLGTLVDRLKQAERPLVELASAIPRDRLPIFLAQVRQLRSDVADEVLDASWEVGLQPTPVLAAAASTAYALPVARALVWSSRLRNAGHGAACPLLAIADNPDRSLFDRACAAATAVAAFGDDTGRHHFENILRGAVGTTRDEILAAAAALCPELASDVPPAPIPPRPSSADNASDMTPSDSPPTVSIVIPCWNQAHHTIACLQSVARHTDPTQIEIILVDNGSTDATRTITGVGDDRFHVIRNDDNLGFGPACNQGAGQARCKYLLFLNNDVIVREGWLEPLVAALDADETLAAVQPRLVYPDGRLNDAGGLVFRGGEPWVYGKGNPTPNAPAFACRRMPDYASGACLLVRTDAFHGVGGFDDRYAPAYFEDTDLSFALRQAGWGILYEPASTVVHLEGGTAGTDTSVGMKRFQERNAARFAEKWRNQLTARPAAAPAIVEAWAHRPQDGFGPGECRPPRTGTPGKRILVIDPAMPMIDRASGSLRLYHILKALRAAGHAVTFYAAAGGDRRYADLIGQLGITCYGGDPSATDPVYKATMFRPLNDILSAQPYDVVIMSPWQVGEASIPGIRRTYPDMTLVLDTNDVHFRRLERAALLPGSSLTRTEVAALRRRELDVYRSADRVVCVTDADAAAVRDALPSADIVIVPNVHPPVDTGPGFEERAGNCFVGNFLHPPNGDALRWWTEDVQPALARRGADPSLNVVGNDPLGTAASFASPTTTVVGYVPDTLPWLHAARISVAPLRYGAGMKGKVGEAMVAGLPVVATSIAAEGMNLVDGEHLLIADTAEAFADAVIRLSTDPVLWQHLRDSARLHVLEHFGPGELDAALQAVLAPRRSLALHVR